MGVQALALVREILDIQREELCRANLERDSAVNRYTDLLKRSPVAHVSLDCRGLITEANFEASEMLGTPRHRLVGQGLTRFIQCEDHIDYFELIHETFCARGASKRGTCELRLLRGKILPPLNVHAEVLPLHDAQDRHVGWDITLVDFTRLKSAEDGQRRSEAKYRSVLDAAVDAIIVMDGETGVILDVNSSAVALYGYDREEFLRLKLPDLLAGDMPFLPTAPGPSSQRTYHIKRDGTVFPVETTLSRHVLNGLRVSVLFSRDIAERAKTGVGLDAAQRDREESEGHLRALSSRLLSIQEEERKRIARELHDSIGQSLAALKFSLEHIVRMAGPNNSEETQGMLENTVPVIQRTIEEVRSICTGLRPSILDDLGIAATLQWFCREFQATYSNYRIQLAAELEEKSVPELIKVVVFRVVQEALNNVAKHSQADNVDLSLKVHGNSLMLTIEDNGIGFDGHSPAHIEKSRLGMGLTSMRERVELSGGVFSIRSAPGKGTRIRALWEL